MGLDATPVRRSRAPLVRRQHHRGIATREVPGGGGSPVLELQRQIGNAAVGDLLRTGHGGRVASIQRALPAGATISALAPGDASVVAIATAVNAYNQHAGAEATAAEYNASFLRLRSVDRLLHRWFDQVSAAHSRFQGVANTAELKNLLAASETEHQDLIERSKALADVLPIDTTGMTPLEIGQAKLLWQDIVNSRGKIKLVGGADYNKRVRSELAKVLDTPTGRQLLGFLNAATPGEGAAAAEISSVFIGENLAQLPAGVRAASPDLRDIGHSEAQPIGVDDSAPARKMEALTGATESALLPGEVVDPNQYLTLAGPPDLHLIREAVLTGKRGYTYRSKKYTFAAGGVGGFVTSFPGISKQGGRTGHEILAPGWVTLGHELGHVANMRAGSATIGFKAGMEQNLWGLAGGAGASAPWDNAEEFLNIENIENALRRQAQISERQGHQVAPWAVQLATAWKSQQKRRFEVLAYDPATGDLAWSQHNDWDRLYKLVKVMPAKDVVDDAKRAAVDKQIESFFAVWTPAAFRRWKAAKGL